MKTADENKKLYSLKEACELLSISVATGRNWLKSGRLLSEWSDEKNHPYFSHSFVMHLKEQLADGSVPVLNRRRNKTFVSGTRSYHAYIEKDSANHSALECLLAIPEITQESLLSCLLRDCAEKLLLQSGTSRPVCLPLLQDLADDTAFDLFCREFPMISEIAYTYNATEDTLGFLYLSLRKLSSRKNSGSYYTPVWLARHLITQHLLPALKKSPADASVLDPSCGTGMFLLQLPKEFPLKNLHGTDIDLLAVTLTRLNLAMKYRISSCEELHSLYQNITAADFLDFTSSDNSCKKHDVILGNPPWGAKLTADQKNTYQKQLSCALSGTFESYDLFLEQGMSLLSSDGFLTFLLPEAVLNVKSHRPIRKLLLKTCKVLSVEYLGEVFEQVHCPSIIFTAKRKPEKLSESESFSLGTKVTTKTHTFTIKQDRSMTADCFSFAISETEYAVLNKILSTPNCTTLKGQADFALGIVTGNNAALIYNTAADGMEPIIKGTDISKYQINSYSGYLHFNPEAFQQTAPEHLYRAKEKLFYRFISRELVFAYDNSGLLSLNSCNIVIPRIPGLSIQYILAVLNSKAAQFVFEKQFASVKVLRSHLEAIPIPLADCDTQDRIARLVDRLLSQNKESQEYQQTLLTLDLEMKHLFQMNDKEYSILLSSVSHK